MSGAGLAIFLKDEGGYEIVLKSLYHYKKRLETIGDSPELKDAAMFAPVLCQQAARTIPRIEETVRKIEDSLQDTRSASRLAGEVPLWIKALECYESDIGKARDHGDRYFVGLVGDMQTAVKDLSKTSHAIKRIEFSE